MWVDQCQLRKWSTIGHAIRVETSIENEAPPLSTHMDISMGR